MLQRANPRGDADAVHAAGCGGPRIAARRPRLLAWLPLLALAGCGGAAAHHAPPPPPGPDLPLEPARVAAEFLAAASRRDHAAMASRFGTVAGPIGDRGGALGCAFRKLGSWIGLGDRCLNAREIELRMDLMAAILAHDSYRAGREEMVAGKGRPATRIDFELDTATEHGVIVPFVLIQADDGTWLVEEIGLGRLTG